MYAGHASLRDLYEVSIPELDALQFVFGAGNEGFHRWVKVYQEAQARGMEEVASSSLEVGAARFQRSCAPCHGVRAQGLIGPNLTDDRWIHGGSVEQIFQTIAKGWPAKGMPPWSRAVRPDELSALVSYVRSLQGSNPATRTVPLEG